MTDKKGSSVADHTALLLRLSRMFNSSLDLEEVLCLVMDEVISTLHAERGFIMFQEPRGGFQYKVAHGIHREAVLDPQSEISLSIVHQVMANGKPVLTSNAQDDDRFSTRQSVIILGLRSVLCVPLQVKEKIIGVVYVDNRLAKGIFSPADLDLLGAIASSAAIAIENARLYQIAVEKGYLERELQIARQVQSGLLPKEIPRCPGWEFSAVWQPARHVAGDFYNFLPLGEGELGLLIADVTDKGVPAALFMALSHTILRASLRGASTCAEDMQRANRLICAESTSGYFVTVFYAVLDLPSGQLTYVNAGHPAPIWYQLNGEKKLCTLPRTAMALGIDPEAGFEQKTIQLASGDFVLGYTDGVTEAINARQEMFGENRLESALLKNSTLGPARMLAAVLHAVGEWAAHPEDMDDTTLLIVNRL